MPSDEPNSTWHPAFMPNVAATISPKAPSCLLSSDTLSSQPTEPSPVGHSEADVIAEYLEESQEEAQGQPVDAWFQDQEAGDSWLDQGDGPDTSINNTTEAAPTTDALESVEDAPPTPVIEEPSSTSSKHHSTVSFARTVSDEVNWDNEDDEVEWNLPRTETDPFKFMSPSDRTNSFPVVPPMSKQSPPRLDRPLPSTEAEDLMVELDREPSPIKTAAESSSELAHSARMSLAEDHLETRSPRQYVGGDFPAPDMEASDVRYEEGLPLISQDQEAGAGSNDAAKAEDIFSGGSPAEDDFFNQISGSGDRSVSQDSVQSPPPLERKSTMQVMGANSFDRTGTGLEDTLEESPEEDDFWSQQQPHVEEDGGEDHVLAEHDEDKAEETTDLATTAAQDGKQEGGDLAAQWAAALGDDDDDDLLLDDAAPTPAKGIDPASFFVDDGEGFLEDEEEATQPPKPEAPTAEPVPAATLSPSLNGRYAPVGTATTPAVSRQSSGQSQYLPSPTQQFAATAPPPQPPVATPFASQPAYGAPPPRLEPNRAASFADKSKGGYTSPYDLPVELKPRKRPSTQHFPRAAETPPPPPGPPQLARTTSAPGQAPPAMPQSTPVPKATPTATMPPPAMSSRPIPAQHPVQQSPAAPTKASQRSQSGEGFFAELPMSSRVRPASRSSQRSLNSPTQLSPVTPPHSGHAFPHGPPQGPPQGHPVAPQQQPHAATAAPPSQVSPHQLGGVSSAPPLTGTGGLVAPERVNPYAPLQSSTMPLPSAMPSVSSSRYSPAPPSHPGASAGAPPTQSTRYSPAPAANRPPVATHPPVQHAVPPPILAHQPRTSSPLAHFEVTHDRSRPSSSSSQSDHLHSDRPDRRAGSGLTRVPSLPPTREVEEESAFSSIPPHGPPSSSHSNNSRSGRPSSQGKSQSPYRTRQTSPPAPLTLAQSTLSPPKRSMSYVPQAHQQTLSPPTMDFAPPPRSHTQSPGSMFGENRVGMRSADPVPRPSSVNDPTSPRSAASATYQPTAAPTAAPIPAPSSAPLSRSRGMSQNFNLVPPTDGREHDPLKRWTGAPLIAWGVGGTLVTSFPKNIPLYGMNQSVPMIARKPGDLKIKNTKGIFPLEERLAKFPGPLKGKSKKKETIAWLTTGIEGLERSLPQTTFLEQISHHDKRTTERVLLWKILRLFIEFDGTLEGSPNVEHAVREVLCPGIELQSAVPTAPSTTALYGMGSDHGSFATQMKSDGVDSATVEQIRRNLLVGEREKAVWDAADKRLWGHALLIANTVSPDLYKKVSQEFVRKEVNYPGHNNEPLAVLYEVLSGNHEECVDELVPSHARAGYQLMDTSAHAHSSRGPSTDRLAALDKWRETLGLVLSNRSSNDVRAINALGVLLSGYGRAEAAHICYLFARSATVFGGLDDPSSHFVLVGADHKTQADHFAKDTEALLLSEVYEYGLSLAGGSRDVNCPHLAAYKLQHAMILAEHGYRDKALQYCEGLASAITAQTRRSPYHHASLEAAVDDLTKRLRQAPKEESNSWIPKPSMNKVSDSMWNRFNKFVNNDEGENGANGLADGAGEAGPFARLAGGTPTISRPPSTGPVTGMEMFGGVVTGGATGPLGYPAPAAPAIQPPPTTRAASRYAPQAATNPYDPTQSHQPMAPPSTGRSSGEYSRGSPEFTRRSSEIQRSAYIPTSTAPNNMPSPTPSAGYGMNHDSSPSFAPVAASHLSAPPSEHLAPASYGGYQPYAPPDYATNGSPYAAAGHGSADEKLPATTNADSESPESGGYQLPSYGYEPPTMTPYESMSTEKSEPAEEASNSTGGYEPPSYQPSGYEPPSFQPSSYEPPTYEPGPEDPSRDEGDKEVDKRSASHDVSASVSLSKPADKTKEEKDRENAELFRKAAEEDAKRAEAEKAAKAKKGGWLGGWFGGGGGAKKEPDQPKAIRAKLGEQNSFYYDADLKRWVNKKAGADAGGAAAAATPPPPRSAPRSVSGTPPPPSLGRSSAPPRGPGGGLTMSASIPNLAAAAAASASQPSLVPGSGGPPIMQRSVSNTSEPPTSSAAAVGITPPSRPGTSMSNASSIDDLISAAGPRKAGAKKPRKGGRYIDVMAK